VVAFFNDITERRRNDCILKARLRLGNLPPEVTCDDMLQMILDEAELVTDSKIGFYHDLEEDGITLRLQNWSTNTLANMCTAEGKGSHYPVDEAGIWAEAVRQGIPVICNDYPNALNKRGIPEGHAPVTRFISVPIRYNDRIVSIIGVGNKPEDYDQLDVDAVLVLANETLNVIQRKRAEDRLLKFNEELEQRVEERTSQLIAAINEQEAFSYTISHDLRAPLRAINGYTSIIEEKYNDQLDDEGWRLLNVVKSEALRMGILIDDLLTFSRLNRAQLVRNSTDMNQLVQTVVQDLTHAGQEKRTDFRIGSLHPADADGNLIRQVWFNLISNAQKFTSKRESPVIEIGSRLEEHEVQYYVHDNGSGFNMQYVDKIFGVFQRLHDDNEYPGTGVGLAIVERIVQRHGGRVWAEGEPGKGATFWFTLPMV
jgi:signal transduction histidine kinase